MTQEVLEKQTFKGRISTDEAIKAYQRVHGYAMGKREISKLQKEEKAVVEEFLANNPEGFNVWLEDAKGNRHEYHVANEEKTRLSLIKDVLANKIGCAVNELKPSLLAEAVEQGVISLSDIRAHEELSEYTAIKKTKIKKPRKKKGE